MPLLAGTPAPWFTARTPSRPDYAFSSVGGRYVLLVFMPAPGPERDRAMALLRAQRSLFDDVRRIAFGVIGDAALFETLKDEVPGLRWFFDPEGEIAERFKLRGADGRVEGQWVLLDPTLRVIFSAPLADSDRAFDHVRLMDNPETHAGVILHAPVLVVPRIIEPALCRRLIETYHAHGGQVSGVMREVDGKTVGVVDDFKKRRDADILDPALQAELRARVSARLLPEGALQLVCGGVGDLFDHLGCQDIVSFTGSASTARKLRNLSKTINGAVGALGELEAAMADLERDRTPIDAETERALAAVVDRVDRDGTQSFLLDVCGRCRVRDRAESSGVDLP